MIGFSADISRPDLVMIRYVHSFRDNPPLEKMLYKRICTPITDLKEIIKYVELDKIINENT